MPEVDNEANRSVRLVAIPLLKEVVEERLRRRSTLRRTESTASFLRKGAIDPLCSDEVRFQSIVLKNSGAPTRGLARGEWPDPTLFSVRAPAERLVTSYSCRREPASHSSQVLSCCSHQELVTRPAYASQPQSVELQNAFQVGKQHLHLLPLLA